MALKESAENYLEMIYNLEQENGVVRSIDIANELGFSKPSVSVAMKKLRESGYIHMDKNGYITLEKSGYEIASQIQERHSVLSKALISIGVSKEAADKDACKIEHVISDETYRCLRKFIENS